METPRRTGAASETARRCALRSISRHWRRIMMASSMKSAPVSVGVTPLRERANSVRPYSRSNVLICLASAGVDMFSRRAACAKLPVSAAAMTASSRLSYIADDLTYALVFLV
ncbi:hypothetical protein BREU_2102 [Bifidobacterium reuteri DSM 23975]|uniref:Uncharacterized protein n=1 Tax=Bifidobacterium reuteri DSM 23975 TaxID=1437610 RepID=A0A087CPM1_9BIFI|nr:hypothetical protein BREU_2102 [Bifidobacterium reuteri DSM 23975]